MANTSRTNTYTDFITATADKVAAKKFQDVISRASPFMDWMVDGKGVTGRRGGSRYVSGVTGYEIMEPLMTELNILMVDDTTANLQILRETLAGCGYRLLSAKGGASALSIAAKAQPDLILLDIVMPEMDGYEVCRRLRNDGATRPIPVIFLTALDDAADEARGLALGAVDYITKPIHPELVRARVHTHLELKRHRDHLEQLVREKTRECG